MFGAPHHHSAFLACMGRQRTTTSLSRSSRNPAASSSRTLIHLSWTGPGFSKRSAVTPGPKYFPSTGLTGWKWRLTIPPPLRMVDQNGVEFLGHDVVTCPIRIFRTRDTDPVPRLGVNLANAVVGVRAQGPVPTLMVTFFVE